MKNLIIKFLFINLICLSNLFALVNLNLPSKVISNEPFIFEIEVVGSSIEFPKIDSISGNTVQEVSSSSSIMSINSKVIKKVSKVYSLNPSSDFIFPSLEFMIDGNKEFTKEQKIVLEKPTKTKLDILDLSIKASKNELYVGENFVLTLILKYKKGTSILNLSLNAPKFDGFWYKQLDDSLQYEEDDYLIQELKFLLAPLKNGLLNINPLSINAQVVNAGGTFSFMDLTKNIKVYSNDLSFNIKALPSNVKLIGDFNLEATIDKNRVNQGEAISYKLKINGVGNIDDIPDIKLDMQNCLIYENKPEIKTKLENNEYKGTYEKVFSIIPNDNITIPSVNIEFFDKKNAQVKRISSQTFNIEVIKSASNIAIDNKLQKEDEVVEVVKIVEKSSLIERLIFFILGVIVALLLVFIYFYYLKEKKNKQEYNTPLVKKVKKTQNKNELLKVLAAYLSKDKALDKMIFTLEKTDEFLLIKKEIINKIKDLKL